MVARIYHDEPPEASSTATVLGQTALELVEARAAIRRLCWENDRLREMVAEDARARDKERSEAIGREHDLLLQVEDWKRRYRAEHPRFLVESVCLACVAAGFVLAWWTK